MDWRQFVMDLDSLDPDTVEATFIRLGAVSVTLSDAGDNPVLEPAPGETPLWSQTRITGMFPGDADMDVFRKGLLGALGVKQLPDHRIEDLADRAWEREWLKDFGAMRFGERLWICPTGSEVEDDGAVVVHLDPGLAFGTGTHPTTALCLEWLDGIDLAGKTLLDYGCGSGILAIAAARLGARRVVAIDNDPQALIATRDNAAANEVTLTVEAPSTEAPAADILLANILAGPLIELAPTFAAAVRPGGKLVISGILATQGAAVAAAYEPWFELNPPAAREDWLRIDGCRRPEES